jgi:hypothetical protein
MPGMSEAMSHDDTALPPTQLVSPSLEVALEQQEASMDLMIQILLHPQLQNYL